MKKAFFTLLLLISVKAAMAYYTINVMIVATDGAITGLGGPEATSKHVFQDVNNINQSFINSGINARINVVYTAPLNFPQVGCMYTLLDLVVSIKGGPPIQDLHEKRNDFAADIVMIIVDEPSQCGISGSYGAIDEAFLIVDYRCLGANYSMARQLGYLLGCGNNDSQSGRFNSFNEDAQAFFFENEREKSSFSTIMGYTDESISSTTEEFNMIPYWSSGDTNTIRYKGIPVGDEAHDNAQQINLNVSAIVNYRNIYGNIRMRKIRVRSYNKLESKAVRILDYEDSWFEDEAEAYMRAKRIRLTKMRIEKGASVSIRSDDD